MKRAAIVFVLAVVLASAAGAHRASRPADDWIATLEAPDVIVDYLATQGPHRDDPSLQVGKEEAAR